MNYIRHLSGFYEKVEQDHRLNPTHISLYLALFQFWNINHFQNPISISRNEMMKLSKIAAFGTYHKCIKELQEFGYIEYFPSFNPYKGSLVNLFNFDTAENENPKNKHTKKQTTPKQALNQHHIKIDTSIRQALEPSINYINLLNNKHIYTTQATHSNFEYQIQNPFSQLKAGNSNFPEVDEKEKLRQKKSAMLSPTPVEKNHSCNPLSIPPKLDEVFLYFEEKEAPKSEAHKFFDHYESNGWLVGGKSKMKNWQAAARNWFINAKKFNETPPAFSQNPYKPKPNNLQATTNKNYKEPL